MTRISGPPRADSAAWIAESLRATTFHAADVIDGMGNLWRDVVGHDPESSVSNRTMGLRADVGRHAEMSLALQVQKNQGRIDWIRSISPGMPNLDEVASLPRMSGPFTELMAKWMGQCPATTRLAFGASLLMRTKNPAEGHKTLSGYLNFDIDAGVVSDFNYQANRQSSSATDPTILINRLTKWGVVQTILQTINITAQGATIAPGPQEPEYFCRVEIDINTVPLKEGSVLESKTLSDLWAEAVALGMRISREGDVP